MRTMKRDILWSQRKEGEAIVNHPYVQRALYTKRRDEIEEEARKEIEG